MTTNYFRGLVAVPFMLFLSYACGDAFESNQGNGGKTEAGNGGEGPDQGGSSGTGGMGGTSGTGVDGGAAGDSGATGGSATGGGATGGAAGGGGEVIGGASGNGGGGGAGGPPTVTEFGCFARSGDGLDFLENGEVAFFITPGTCGDSISNDPEAHTPQATPTTWTVTREFIVAQRIIDNGIFSIAFEADDAVAISLNGQSLASCTPATGTPECAVTCHMTSIPTSALLGGGQVNRLEVVVTNLVNMDLGGGEFGYTGLGYEVCATSS